MSSILMTGESVSSGILVSLLKCQMIVHVHVTNVNRKETTLVRMCQLMTLASKVVPGT
jgi:hypothetical protein